MKPNSPNFHTFETNGSETALAFTHQSDCIPISAMIKKPNCEVTPGVVLQPMLPAQVSEIASSSSPLGTPSARKRNAPELATFEVRVISALVCSLFNKDIHDPEMLCMATAFCLTRDCPSWEIKLIRGEFAAPNVPQLNHVLVIQVSNFKIYVDFEWCGRFRLARRTQLYEEWYGSVSPVLVASEPSLIGQLQNNSMHVRNCFLQLGMDVPPWRRAEALAHSYRKSAERGIDVRPLCTVLLDKFQSALPSTSSQSSLNYSQSRIPMTYLSGSESDSECDDSNSDYDVILPTRRYAERVHQRTASPGPAIHSPPTTPPVSSDISTATESVAVLQPLGPKPSFSTTIAPLRADVAPLLTSLFPNSSETEVFLDQASSTGTTQSKMDRISPPIQKSICSYSQSPNVIPPLVTALTEAENTSDVGDGFTTYFCVEYTARVHGVTPPLPFSHISLEEPHSSEVSTLVQKQQCLPNTNEGTISQFSDSRDTPSFKSPHSTHRRASRLLTEPHIRTLLGTHVNQDLITQTENNSNYIIHAVPPTPANARTSRAWQARISTSTDTTRSMGNVTADSPAPPPSHTSGDRSSSASVTASPQISSAQCANGSANTDGAERHTPSSVATAACVPATESITKASTRRHPTLSIHNIAQRYASIIPIKVNSENVKHTSEWNDSSFHRASTTDASNIHQPAQSLPIHTPFIWGHVDNRPIYAPIPSTDLQEMLVAHLPESYMSTPPEVSPLTGALGFVDGDEDTHGSGNKDCIEELFDKVTPDIPSETSLLSAQIANHHDAERVNPLDTFYWHR